MIIFLVVIGVFIASALLLSAFNKHLPVWFCNNMGWHLPPIAQSFDGCSFNGECPRCRKKVLQDSQGNWF